MAARVYFLAMVDKEDTTFSNAFARHDENLRSFQVSQSEGDFCGLSVVIEKPSASLLSPTRKQWAWLSMQEGVTITPLFFGRVVGAPADLQNDFVTVDFIAKPSNFEAAKLAVADTLRVAPYWDYAFIDPQMWNDADAVLESRTDVWHIDRLSHAVTVSSIIDGEDGDLNVTSDLLPVDGFSFSYQDAPLRKVNLELRAMWKQTLSGCIDITDKLLAAFKAAGSADGFVTSYTGSGLWDDWPMEGDDYGGVYSWGPQSIEVADGLALKRRFKSVNVKFERAPTGGQTETRGGGRKIYFRRWGFTISSAVNYAIEIDRTEDISFSVYSDVQSIVNDSDDEQSEIITMSSGNIGTPVGPVGGEEIPIGDIGRDSYFPTDRGKRSIEFGLCHARALLMRRARAVEVKFTVPIATAITATCRKSANVYHPGLPGGVAQGKIVSYQFGVDGDNGSESGEITIACLVGRNSEFPAVSGAPTYAATDYVGSDYQAFSGASVVNAETSMRFSPPDAGGVSPAVFGFQSVNVINGEAAQKAILKNTYIDISAACDALNAAHTKVDLRMIPIDVSPREIRYTDTDVQMPIPFGVNLGEVA